MSEETIHSFVQRLVEKKSTDLLSKRLQQKSYSLHLLYLRSLCDENVVRRDLIVPFTDKAEYEEFVCYVNALPDAQLVQNNQLAELEQKLYDGYLILLGHPHSWIVNVRRVESSSVGEAKVESVIEGQRDAFTGNMNINLNLIRNRYRKSTLLIERRKIGMAAGNEIAILYDTDKVSPKLLEELHKQLERIQVQIVQTAGQMQRLLSVKHRWNLFPTMMITERPDRTAFNLASGKVAILLEGDNFALLAPTVFMDFYSAMDDLSQRKPVTFFFSILRSLGLFIAVTLPGFYVAVASFNPELFRVQLILIVAGTRSSVPYPPLLEVLFMLLMMEFLTEASARLPKAIGPAATTVGGLILGQAATSAGLVGDIMIIIVAAVAICNFVVPVSAMTFSIRILKYIVLLMAGLFGTLGIVVSLLGLLLYLTQMDSFGEPYLRLFQTNRTKY